MLFEKELSTWFYDPSCNQEVKLLLNLFPIEYHSKMLHFGFTIKFTMLIFKEVQENKGCKDCFHNYHCPMPQEGYDFNPDTCPYNHDF